MSGNAPEVKPWENTQQPPAGETQDQTPPEVKGPEDTQTPPEETPPVKETEDTQVPELTDAEIDEDMIVAHVPKDFKLTLDGHVTVSYKAGTRKMPRNHAEHWYAKAHGVEVVE